MIRIPAKTFQAFCAADCGIIEQCLAAFPATYGRLAAAIGDHFVCESVTRSPFGPSVPLRTDIDELMRLIVDCALSWHERIASVAGLSAPDTDSWRHRALGPYAPRLLAASVAVLTAPGRVSALLALGREPMLRPSASPVTRSAPVIGKPGWDTTMVEADGSDAGLELLRLDYLSRSALLETDAAPVRFIGVPCRNCQKNALQLAPPAQHDGDPQFHSICTVCRDVMDEPTFHAWAKAWANYYGNRLTPAMAANS